jgi:hypothetical protein
MHGDNKQTYSEEDRNMGLLSKATRSESDIIYMTKEDSFPTISLSVILLHYLLLDELII